MKNNIKKVFLISSVAILAIVFGLTTKVQAQTIPIPTMTTVAATSITESRVTLNGTFTSNGYATTIWFRYGTSSSCSSMSSSTNPESKGASESGSFNATVYGLQTNTTYYFCAVGQNSIGPDYGTVLSFTTENIQIQSAPTISSNSASSLNQNSATLNSTYNGNGASTSLWYEYGLTNSFGTNTSPVNIGSGSGTNNQTISNLQTNTTYYFRAVGQNSGGTAYGSTLSFTTNTAASAPTISSNSATNIDGTYATLNGSYDANNASTNVYFEYGTTTSLGSSTSSANQGTGSGSYSQVISGLNQNTTYYFRLVGQNSSGTSYGTILSFTTSTLTISAPSITTNTVSNIGSTSATLNGYYNANNASTNVYFEYGTTTSLGSSTSLSYQGTGSGNFSQSIYNLNPGNTYYFRLVGQNSSGTSYGTILSFVAQITNGIPTVATGTVTSIGLSYATLNGTFNANNYSTNTRFEYGTTTNLGSYTSWVNQGYSSGSLIQYISGLQANTIYYYRAIGQNNYGTSYGNTLSFRTSGVSSSLIALTSLATSINKNSAKLNGVIINNASIATNYYFEYGKTVNLGNKTIVKTVNANTRENVVNQLINLDANTIYYFRVIAENQSGNISRGEIIIFRTMMADSNIIVNNVNNNDTVITTDEPVVVNNTALLISLKIENESENIAIESEVKYTLTYKNNSSKDIENVMIKIVLPKEITFSKTSEGIFNEVDNTLSVDINKIYANQEGVIIVEGILTKDAQIGDMLITNTTVTYTNPDTKVQEDNLAYVLNTVTEKENNSLTAASLFGNTDFLPKTLTEWILLIFGLAGLIFLGRKFYLESNLNKKNSSSENTKTVINKTIVSNQNKENNLG